MPGYDQATNPQTMSRQDEALLAKARVDLQRYADLLAKEGVTQQVHNAPNREFTWRTFWRLIFVLP